MAGSNKRFNKMIIKFQNKKGSSGLMVGTMIAIVLIVFLLVIILLGGSEFFSRISKTLDFLPIFQQKNVTGKDLEILRYKISNGDMDYYDGSKWINFNNEILNLNGKSIDSNSFKRQIQEFYFQQRSEILQGESGVSDIVFYPSESVKPNIQVNNYISFDNEKYLINNFDKFYIGRERDVSNIGLSNIQDYSNSGEIIATVIYRGKTADGKSVFEIEKTKEAYDYLSEELKGHVDYFDKKVYSYFYTEDKEEIIIGNYKMILDKNSVNPRKYDFYIENNVIQNLHLSLWKVHDGVKEGRIVGYIYTNLLYYDASKIEGDNKIIYDEMLNWFNSILKNPILLSYFSDKDGKGDVEEGYFCLEKKWGDLVFYFNKEVSEDHICEGIDFDKGALLKVR